MPNSKTIEIDEIIPAENSGNSKREPTPKGPNGKKAGSQKKHYNTGQAPRSTTQDEATSPFPDIASSLGWKARLTLLLTQWFLFLRSKPWGKWVIAPVVVLGILLIIPLAIIAMFGVFLMALFRPLLVPRR